MMPSDPTPTREARLREALLVLNGEYEKTRVAHREECAKVGPYGGVGLGGGSRSDYACTCGQPERQAIVDAGIRAARDALSATPQPTTPATEDVDHYAGENGPQRDCHNLAHRELDAAREELRAIRAGGDGLDVERLMDVERLARVLRDTFGWAAREADDRDWFLSATAVLHGYERLREAPE